MNAIQRVARGKDGYLWLATWDGLVRYDGARFTVFNTGNTEALPSNRLADMTAAADGSLWLRTEQDHLVRTNGARFTHFDSTHGLPDRSVRSVFVAKGSTVLAGTTRGVFRLRGDRFESLAPEAVYGEVTAVLEDASGAVWAGTRELGLFRIEEGRAQSIQLGESARITVLRQSSSGVIWIGTSKGVFRAAVGHVARVPRTNGKPFSDPVADIRVSPAGEAWISTESGVYVLRDSVLSTVLETPGRVSGPGVRFAPDGSVWYAAGDRLYHDGREVFRVPASNANELRAVKQIQDFQWDTEGSLWIGTYNRGLYRLKASLFQVVSSAEGLRERNVTTVMQDRSAALWIGTLGGGFSSLKNGVVSNFSPSEGFPAFVLSFLQDRQGALWVGTYGEGIRYCRLPVVRCTAPPGGQPAPGGTVRALFEDAAGDVYAGTEDGLFRLRQGRWRRLFQDTVERTGAVRGVAKSPGGAFFLSTNGSGVLVYYRGTLSRIDRHNGLPSDLVRGVYQDSTGALWVATEGRGLARVTINFSADHHAQVTSVRSIRQTDGLFDEVIHQILPDAFGRLWMSSNRGIFWTSLAELREFADRRTSRIHSTAFTERDGLRNREANGGQSPSGIVSRDGRLWFATQDGAVAIDPARARSNAIPPQVVIQRFLAADRIAAVDSGEVHLRANERNFEIDYAALSLVAPENGQFRYRLRGLSDAWTSAGNRRTAFFTNVPPGNYTFQVVASNNDGVWNEDGATLTLRVEPYFRETRAAYVLLGMLVALLAWGTVRWRERALHERERELTALVEERAGALLKNEALLTARNAELAALHQSRSQLFANVSHEFRTPLTLILGPLRSLLAGRHGIIPHAAAEQAELMVRNAERLLRLVNRVLDLSRLEDGGLTLHTASQDLGQFVRATVTGFLPLAQERLITLACEVPEEAITVVFDTEQLEKVLLNLLSNALKFTESGGHVHVRLATRGESAVIAVHDTGVGIAPEQLPRVFERFFQGDASLTRKYEGSGIGLALASELVALHGGSMHVQSTLGEGSVFEVRMPLVVGSSRAFNEGDERTTILVIDDNADMRGFVRTQIDARYRVLEAADGREGLGLALSSLPDLIIADVMMPEMDGLSLGRALKADAMTDTIPLILVTARAAPEDQIAGWMTGADAYVLKPFDAAVLNATVDNLLRQRQLLRERYRDRGDMPVPQAATEPTPIEALLRPLIVRNIHDASFGPDALAAAAGLSYHQLYRGLRDELHVTPSRFIRGVRVEYAAELLRRNEGTITQVAYAVGFDSLSYFRRAFRERFGVSPSDYLLTVSTQS
ncbi:MAG: helix-turn-helix domain-containing protein [Gemmatimonas sp.]|nr:helix-turn-helix domain-containing protein [Gemmatimonas sp.]